MISNRKLLGLMTVWLLYTTMALQAAEKSNPQDLQEKADYTTEDGAVVLHGTIAPLPSATTIKDYNNPAYSPGTSLMPAFPSLTKEDIIARFACQSKACQDWDAHYHPLLQCTCPDYLPALLPIVYKSPTPHPYFLKKEVAAHLTELPQPLRSIVSEYAENPCSLLDCTQGDVIQITMPNRGNKKAIAQFMCTNSYGDPFKIQLARGLVTTKITPQLKQALKEEVEAYDTAKKNEEQRLFRLMMDQAAAQARSEDASAAIRRSNDAIAASLRERWERS